VWVAGCATGEEAYSLAILFNEELTRRKDKRRLKVLATDVHRGSLDFASRGLYTKDRVAHVQPDLLERYFDQRGPNYQVSPDLRQFVVFAPHNVVRDAPFTRIDLVSCRNLLIYLQPLAQKKVLNLLHFALKRQGVLILGPSENAGTLADDFDTVDTHWRIYRKRRDLRLPNDTRIAPPRQRGMTGQHDLSTAAGYSLSQVVAVYDALLNEHIPPSLLVNERRELVHSFARRFGNDGSRPQAGCERGAAACGEGGNGRRLQQPALTFWRRRAAAQADRATDLGSGRAAQSSARHH
jgi:two-component system CheB/CheR fusion protein